MGLRVQIEKLLLVLHIRSLDEETLAGKIYEEQKQQPEYMRIREEPLQDNDTVSGAVR